MEKQGACLCTECQGAAPSGLWQQRLANSRDKQLSGKYWDEKEQKGLQCLNTCLRGSLYPFQLMSASRPPVLSLHTPCALTATGLVWGHISAVSHGGLWNNAWPTLSGRWFVWHLAWNYSATASWRGKLFKDQGEIFSPLLPHVRATRSFSSTWHMWQSGMKVCAVFLMEYFLKQK